MLIRKRTTLGSRRFRRAAAVLFALLAAISMTGCQPPDPDADRARTKATEPTVDEQLNSSNDAETRKGIDRAKQKWGAPQSPKKDEAKGGDKTDEKADKT
jgi:hypothetical protein